MELPQRLYTAALTRQLDGVAISEFALPGFTLMSRAAEAAFSVLRMQWPRARRLRVLCGVGNNGGDGLLLATLAAQAGLKVDLSLHGDPARLTKDASRALTCWLEHGSLMDSKMLTLQGYDLVVDALLGTGLQRPIEGVMRSLIESVNRSKVPVLAIDIPSGLNADSGTVMGVAIRAAATVTFISLKQGMFTHQGPDYCGTLLFDDLQLPKSLYSRVDYSGWRVRGRDYRHFLSAPRAKNSHKGSFGHLLLMGGDIGMSGAICLSGEAALRCGSGVVSVATHPHHAGFIAQGRSELMCRGVDNESDMDVLIARSHLIAIGPGLGQGAWSKRLWQIALESGKPLLMDADALNLLAKNPRHRDDWVLTPHPAEAARLLGCDTTEVQLDRFAAIRELQARYGGVIVLKGNGTLMAGDAPHVSLISCGNPGMAAPGMGDLLSGVIAALMVQGLPPFEAASCGAWLHASAGDLAAMDGERGLIASDLFPHLRHLVNRGGDV